MRLRLMHDVLGRFFQPVLLASLLTGQRRVDAVRVARQVVQSGGCFEMSLAWTVMAVLGVAMVAIFMHIRFVLSRGSARLLQRPSGARVVRSWARFAHGSRSTRLGVLVLLVTLMRWTN